MSKSLTYIEVDVDFCSRRYGVSPCTAALGVTGSRKCFNSLGTCQDRVNFNNEPVTLRFGMDIGYLPDDIECFPSLIDVTFNPSTISLGEDIGQRATLTVRFKDHRHSDTGPGFDPYVSERDYDPFAQGTFFGKFRARQPYLRNRNIRLIRGVLGQTLAEMETRHYIVEDFDGPTPSGIYTLVAKDILKLTDGDRAQAPALSNGFLVAGINAAVTSLTLAPAGVGDLEYPTSGFAAIGGEEIVSFTRVGDVMTITRGQRGTEAQEHDTEDRVQLCLEYVSESPSDIIRDLLVNYANVPDAYIPLTTWQLETSTYLQRLYSALIAEPTEVKKLVSELIEQAALALWWDDLTQTLKLQVLRQILTSADVLNEDNTMESTLAVKEQPGKRITEIWTYYGQRNALRPIDEADNYRSTLATVALQVETDYGATSIKKIYSRWIPAFGQQVAERLNNIQLARYKEPPRLFNFEIFRFGADTITLGGGYQVAGWSLQDDTGAPVNVPVQIVRLNAVEDRFQIEAEEALFESDEVIDLVDRVIIIDGNINAFNLRTVHDSIYPDPSTGESPTVNVTCIISEGVIIGSGAALTTDPTTGVQTYGPAFDVGTWPVGIPITVRVLGRIQGHGGRGGMGAIGGPGSAGGTALYTRTAINLEVVSGEIWGGGGGGEIGLTFGDDISGGGGGAGQIPGDGGSAIDAGQGAQAGAAGTTEAGGAGGQIGSPSIKAGDGGGPGLPGNNGTITGGVAGAGAAGVAIDGISFITITSGPGDRRGAEIN